MTREGRKEGKRDKRDKDEKEDEGKNEQTEIQSGSGKRMDKR